MINFSKLNLTEGMDPIEQSASDKSVESADKKRNPSPTVRQKNQMAQQIGQKQKSNVVYASESITKAFNRQKIDWRQELEEHRGTPAAEQQDDHPYVDVMPMTDQKEKRAKEQMDMAKRVGVQNATKLASEDLDFDTLMGKLIDEEVKKNPWPARRMQHTPKTKEEAERIKAQDKKLFDRKYFDSARD